MRYYEDYEEEFEYEEEEESYPVSMYDWMQYNGLSMSDFIQEEQTMQKQTVEFVVQTKENIVDKVGKSSVLVPKTNYDGRKTCWFDDSRLIKANRK